MDKEIIQLCRRLRKVVRKHALSISYPHNLCGMCAITSFALVKLLNDRGIPAQPVVGYACGGYGHCWVESQGMVIDLTATQFKQFEKKPLVMFPLSEKGKHQYVTNIEMEPWEYNNLGHWPIEQQPVQDLVEKLLKEMR